MKLKLQEIAQMLRAEKIPFQENYPLASHSTFRVGGLADFFVKVHSFKTLKALQRLIVRNKIPFFFLGGGSNLLISDQGFSGVIISLDIPERTIVRKETASLIRVRGYANFRTSWFAKQFSRMGYTNLEFMTTIPGQLGGALVQNAGCYGSEMKDVICKVYVSEDSSLKIFYPETSDFSYRSSIFKKNKHIWVYAMDFALPKGDDARISQKVEEYQKHRIRSQPKDRRSVGSIFKNPEERVSSLKAWQLIEKVGLKGYQIGGAEWSKEHSNFIINPRGASASDIYQLIRLAEKEVKKKENVMLEREVILLGDFNEIS